MFSGGAIPNAERRVTKEMRANRDEKFSTEFTKWDVKKPDRKKRHKKKSSQRRMRGMTSVREAKER